MAVEKQRSLPQNNSIHLYCELLAEELNNGGLDMRLVLKPEIDIPWSMETVKDYLWKPIQKARLQKEHTADLDTKEVDIVYNILNRHIGEKFGVHVPFPSREEVIHRNRAYDDNP